MLKKSTCWTILIYGIIIALLGYMGYQQGGSIVSFYMGGSLGALLVICSLLMFARIHFAAYGALFITLALTGTFAIRYSLSGKSIPAILAVLSGGMLLFLLAQSARWKK
jgi:uncharacterized membrane protein (UPF0136 family)